MNAILVVHACGPGDFRERCGEGARLCSIFVRESRVLELGLVAASEKLISTVR